MLLANRVAGARGRQRVDRRPAADHARLQRRGRRRAWGPTSAPPTPASRSPTCAGDVLAERAREIAVAEGPDPLLTWLEATIEELLGEAGRDLGALRGIGVGLPGPVEHVTGRAVNPPIMPGWNHYPVSERLSQHFGVPALVDNDVNIMAVGEHWVNWRDEAFLLFVKIGTGIGSGIVAGGHVHRGADGAAGDIGHIHVPDHDDVVCRCGNVGCLEAVAGGRAMANRLHELGLPTDARAATSCSRCWPVSPTRCGWCARPATRSAACWPPA